jgi:hypothetical protein
MSDFYSLFDLAQIKAIQVALEPTLESIWLIRCREYSVKYHTPLHVVVNELDPMFVLQQLFEDRFTPSDAEEDLEGILEKLYKIKDPSYSRMTAAETEELVDAVLNKELKRLSKKKNTSEEKPKPKEKSVVPPNPKSGSMSFGSLESLESKVEANKAGFEDET